MKGTQVGKPCAVQFQVIFIFEFILSLSLAYGGLACNYQCQQHGRTT